MRWLGSITDSMDMSLRKLWGMVKDRGAWRVAVHGIANSRTRLSDWTMTTKDPSGVEVQDQEGRKSSQEVVRWGPSLRGQFQSGPTLLTPQSQPHLQADTPVTHTHMEGCRKKGHYLQIKLALSAGDFSEAPWTHVQWIHSFVKQKPQYPWMSVPAVAFIHLALGKPVCKADATGGSNKEAGQDPGSRFCCPSEVTCLWPAPLTPASLLQWWPCYSQRVESSSGQEDTWWWPPSKRDIETPVVMPAPIRAAPRWLWGMVV